MAYLMLSVNFDNEIDFYNFYLPTLIDWYDICCVTLCRLTEGLTCNSESPI